MSSMVTYSFNSQSEQLLTTDTSAQDENLVRAVQLTKVTQCFNAYCHFVRKYLTQFVTERYDINRLFSANDSSQMTNLLAQKRS